MSTATTIATGLAKAAWKAVISLSVSEAIALGTTVGVAVYTAYVLISHMRQRVKVAKAKRHASHIDDVMTKNVEHGIVGDDLVEKAMRNQDSDDGLYQTGRNKKYRKENYDQDFKATKKLKKKYRMSSDQVDRLYKRNQDVMDELRKFEEDFAMMEEHYRTDPKYGIAPPTKDRYPYCDLTMFNV